MTHRNNPQTIACFLNLNQSFSNLYELKFKGKKMLEEIINIFWQRQNMAKQIKGSLQYRQSIIYKSAIANCTSYLTIKISDFEQEFMKKYIENLQVSKRNIDYLFSGKEAKMDILMDDYEILLQQLIQLSKSLAIQYQNQSQLILRFWQIVTSNYIQQNKNTEQLKELMLHIGFQTQIDSQQQQTWKTKIFTLSNQRYNSKKV